jgi:hypothetical protein
MLNTEWLEFCGLGGASFSGDNPTACGSKDEGEQGHLDHRREEVSPKGGTGVRAGAGDASAAKELAENMMVRKQEGWLPLNLQSVKSIIMTSMLQCLMTIVKLYSSVKQYCDADVKILSKIRPRKGP